MRLRVSVSNLTSPSIRRGSVVRYALSLILLVAIIGGIAWVAQYLPTMVKPKEVVQTPDVKPSLEFVRYVAQWYPPKVSEKKEGEATPPTDKYPQKDFEQGTNGFYDFLFKNTAESEVEIVFYTTDCDCNSVQACTLPATELEQLIKLHNEKPGEPLPYTKEPDLKKLSRELLNNDAVRVKAGEGGVVRVSFNAKKSPGQTLNVGPRVWYQPVGVSTQRQWQALMVPVVVAAPVSFHPSRLSVGVLSADGVAEGRLIAWSSTRSELKLKLGEESDPFFKTETQPLSKDDYASLEEALKNQKSTSTIRSAVQVNVQVHERNKEKKQQLDLGSFYRKLPVYLDGILNVDVPGPEIVGRVDGNLMIGGADDQGRVRFRSFPADRGGKKVVEISADEKAMLETYNHQPSWVEVDLKLDKKRTPPKNRRIWILEARVPPNTPAVRSFEEPDAVVLQVTTGDTKRLVRIPLEGHISGQ